MSGVNSINTMGSLSKPTSKVLQPPGGGSSNIFGNESEPVTRAAQRSSNIFGDPEEQKTHTGVRRFQNQSSNIFGTDPEPVKQPAKKEPEPVEEKLPEFVNEPDRVII